MNRGLGRGVKPGEGSEIRRANDSKVQRFFFPFHDFTNNDGIGRPSLYPIEKTKGVPPLDIDFLSESWILLVFRKGGEESSLWQRMETNFPSLGGTEQRNSITESSVSPAFPSNSLRFNVLSRIYTYIYIWKIERHELSIGINTSMVDDFPRYTSNLESLSCSNTRSRLNFEEVKHVTECTLLFSPSDGEIAKVSVQVKFSRDSMVIGTNGRADDVRKERNR